MFIEILTKSKSKKDKIMCGIIGVISRGTDVIDDARVLLNAENNRGEQACGVAVFDGKRIRYYYGEGKVSEVFGRRDQARWSKLTGFACVAQCLYSTISGNSKDKKQPKTQQPVPFVFKGHKGAISHNGNIIRLESLRKQAAKNGYKFKSETSDTEVIAALLSTSKEKDFLAALTSTLKKIEGKGSFSLAILYGGKLYGVRDQNGNRPLCLIKKHGGDTDIDEYILASESSVFPNLGATRFVRDINVGELIVLGPEGIEKSFKWTENTKPAFCVAEFIYSANPASRFFGVSVYAFRVACGEMSARKHPVKADVVVPVPESGRGYDDGFSSVSGIPSREGLIKSRYTLDGGRTFMEAREVNRRKKQTAKLQANPDVMGGKEGKDVCLVDDSIFRGSVIPTAVKMSREHGGARAVHVRICSPPVCHCCHLGLDTSTLKQLVAAHMTPIEINNKIIHADSLEYLTVEELRDVLKELGLDPNNFCFGCFTGKYPVPPPIEME
jgi:amidophosphoribosyltransferase